MKRIITAALLISSSFATAAGNSFGGQVSVTTAAQSITTLLSLSSNKNARQLSIKIDPASSNTIYCGPSTVTNVPANARIVISNASGNSYTWGGGSSMNIGTDDIFCVATTSTTTSFIYGAE